MADANSSIDAKRCTACEQIKSLDDFSPDGRAKDGRQSRCRECSNAQQAKARHADPVTAREKRRDYYQRNKEMVLATNAKSRERHREKILAHKRSVYEGVKDTLEYKQYVKRYAARTKVEKREYDRRYREINADRLREIQKRWVSQNRHIVNVIKAGYRDIRRANQSGGASSREVVNWKAAQKKECYWCGAKCARLFHVDHYQPLSKGGTHTVDNLVIACPRCNLTKNAKDPYEFAAQVGRLF